MAREDGSNWQAGWPGCMRSQPALYCAGSHFSAAIDLSLRHGRKQLLRPRRAQEPLKMPPLSSITCPSCSARFAIPQALFERRLAGRRTIVRCRNCGGHITIDATDAVPSSDRATESAAPASSAPASGASGITEVAAPAAPTRTEATPSGVGFPVAPAAQPPAPERHLRVHSPHHDSCSVLQIAIH